MSRYLVALTDAGGTLPPELGAVRRLLAAGHDVEVLGDPSMAEQVAATGAGWQAWTRPSTTVRDWELRSPTALAAAMAEQMVAGPSAAQADDVTAAIDRTRPDAVVTSFVAVGAMIAAEAARLPYAVLIPNIYALPAPGIPPFGTGLAPARGPLGRLRDRVAVTLSTRLFDRYALAPVNATRAAYGLPPLSSAWQQHGRAARQLVLTAAAFDFPGELPPTARYVGPVLDDPVWAGGEVVVPPGDEPLVVVAMSSTFQDHRDCLQRVVDALRGLPVRGVVTTGPAIDPQHLHGGGRVAVVASAPHAELIPEADLVVTHGGHGTVMKALAAEVPMVVMHHGRDQADNAVRLTRRGAAVAISRRSGSPAIAAAVTRVLEDPGYRAAAATLGQQVREAAGSGALLAELEALPTAAA